MASGLVRARQAAGCSIAVRWMVLSLARGHGRQPGPALALMRLPALVAVLATRPPATAVAQTEGLVALCNSARAARCAPWPKSPMPGWCCWPA